jgi:undecaprenyl pyrophosphate phosphatase UppP
VSLFAILGDIYRPKSFAGLFGAAPSIALATLGLTIHKHGDQYAASEARSMVLGAIAFFFYAIAVSYILMRYRPRTELVTFGLAPIWFGVAFGLWAILLR